MGDTVQLTLSQDLVIENAHALKPQLVDALERAAHLELDLEQVAEMDSAGLQLLLLARREADRQGKTLHIRGCNDSLRQTLAFCRLDTLLGDEAQPAANRQN
ncbi:anti-sigma factor antagonist [Aquitalea sp. S1-19]|nr:anti-sigma factor antagonist [Aquitalea sp. S1-19]